MNAQQWEAEERRPLDMIGTIARWGLVLFGVMFSLSCAAQVDPTSIVGHAIGDEAPWLVKLCGSMMSLCLAIIWWQQRQLNKLHVQLRADFREMMKVSHRFLDQIEKSPGPASYTVVDKDVADLIELRRKHGK